MVNSLDSLIRLYTDNLGLSVARYGRTTYILGNLVALSALTLLFKLEFLQIEWVGALVIALYLGCFAYILWDHTNNRLVTLAEAEASAG